MTHLKDETFKQNLKEEHQNRLSVYLEVFLKPSELNGSVASHFGEVEMRLGQQVGVMLRHQANDVIKHLVLLVEGDGEVDLVDRGQQSANSR